VSCNAGVRGLAQLDCYLYVLQVGRGSSDIAVHDSSTSVKRLSTVVRRLTVPGLRDGADLAACSRHRCLYVADVGSDNVHRLYGLDATLSFQSWPVGDKPWGLSVTSVTTDRYNIETSCYSNGGKSPHRSRFWLFNRIRHMTPICALCLQCIAPWAHPSLPPQRSSAVQRLVSSQLL